MKSNVLCAAMAFALVGTQAHAQQVIEQYIEDSAVQEEIDGSPTEVCGDTDAKWIRVGFDSLVLKGSDSLELVGSDGGSLVLKGNLWQGRSFYMRALPGNCVTLTPDFDSPDSAYTLKGFQAGTKTLDTSKALVTGAGDICSVTNPGNCSKTADLVVAANPNVALTLGDNAYNDGTLSDYNTRYQPNWGRFKDITQPVPGNHEYTASSTAVGYFDYFNGVGNATGPAGDRTKGYYSFDVGDWHFIALNSKTGNTLSATQLAWLDQDLRANTKPCTAAYWHHAFISRGNYTGYATMKPIFDRLYASRADLALVAHDHNYQRWAPMDGGQNSQTDGVRQVIVGTGGGPMYAVNGTHVLLEKKQSSTYGILKVSLSPVDWAANFVPIAGKTFTDSFAGQCHRASETVPDFLLQSSPSIAIKKTQTGGKVITVGSYGGFKAPVDLSITGLPSGVTVTWSFDPVTAVANGDTTSRASIRVSSSAAVGTYPIVVKGVADGVERTVGFNLMVK